MVTTEARIAATAEVEAELLARAQTGDPEAFCELGRAHETRLYRQALALGHDPRLAEELTAETLVEGWRSLARFDGSCRFSTWLYAILLHRYHKAVRRPRSRPIPFSDLETADADAAATLPAAPADSPSCPSRDLREREQAAELLAAIATLPDKHQPVVLLRFYEDAALVEIASALGISLGTVKSRLHHALEKLRQIPGLVNLFHERRDV